MGFALVDIQADSENRESDTLTNGLEFNEDST